MVTKEEMDKLPEGLLTGSDFHLRTSLFSLPSHVLRSSDFGLPSSDFRLRTSDFGLRTSDFGLRTPDSGLPTSDFGLRTSVFGLPTSDFGLPTSVLLTRTFRIAVKKWNPNEKFYVLVIFIAYKKKRLKLESYDY
jgi:hypothetical protein